MDTAVNPPLTSAAYVDRISAGCTVQDLLELGATGYRASVIYADPPWTFKTRSNKGKARSAERHYDTMTLTDIADMRGAIDAVAAPDCVLLMWVTMPHLANGLRLVTDWGFTFKTVAFTWVKISDAGKPIMGMGFWTRANAEICILATRGKPRRVSNDVAQIITAKRRGHSAKPPSVRNRIERLLDGPKLELFARSKAPGWLAWGNEIPRADFWHAAKSRGQGVVVK